MRRRAKLLIVLAAGAAIVAFVVTQRRSLNAVAHQVAPIGRQTDVALIAHPRTPADRIVNAAKQEVLDGVRYDASYAAIPYPNGDVSSDRGACTDVIVRALRGAGYDLQQLIHEDMKRDFDAYPKLWGLTQPDASIDHRRVPNHIAFMKRHGQTLPLSTRGAAAATWQPGDLVYWKLALSGATHCGVLSNDRGRDGLPMVIHNIGPATSQEDCLTRWEIIGHVRYPAGDRESGVGNRR
jgi:uncharacterized protein YijF (DUF1287 family)